MRDFDKICALENCTFQAICCVCEERFGKAIKPDNSHGYCRTCAEQVAERLPEPASTQLLDSLDEIY